MKTRLALAVLIALALPSHAQEPPPAAAQVQAATAQVAHPWEQAQAVVAEVDADVTRKGLRGVGSHVDDLENALAQAPGAFAAAATGDADAVYVLTDNPSDTLIALMGAAVADQKNPGAEKRRTVAVHNPYPTIALYLGTYYNEIDKPVDALRVFDAEKALPESFRGLFVEAAPIAGERAIALVKLGRLPEALAVYDEGIKLSATDARLRARMQRGRGYVLTELGRLDEAEAAYQESLKIEPDSQLAKRELEYITRLRFGGTPAPSQIITVKPQTPAGDHPAPGTSP